MINKIEKLKEINIAIEEVLRKLETKIFIEQIQDNFSLTEIKKTKSLTSSVKMKK